MRRFKRQPKNSPRILRAETERQILKFLIRYQDMESCFSSVRNAKSRIDVAADLPAYPDVQVLPCGI